MNALTNVPNAESGSPAPAPLDALLRRSHRLGADSSLVVLGGGNTSAKGEVTDPRGHTRRVLWIKGSGADLATAAGSDFPAVYLDDLLPLETFDALTDEQMIEMVTRALVHPGSRRPSIETLLHAFLPFAHVDHVHADAVCALTNHADAQAAVTDALGERFAYVDWMRPGFRLSKVVAEFATYDGVVLAHHGLVTWSDDSEDCYGRTLAAVAAADAYLARRTDAAASRARREVPRREVPSIGEQELLVLLPALRGRLMRGGPRVLHVDPRLRDLSDREDVADLVAAGVATGDHMLRNKPWSCLLSEGADPKAAIDAVDAYAHRYAEYVERNLHTAPEGTTPHESEPCVLLVPGLGAVTTGADVAEAGDRAETALHTHRVAARVRDAFGECAALPEAETFGFDYWPLELDKLARRPAPALLSGQVVIVTGAASGIGRTTARELARLGANVVLGDLDGDGLGCAHEEFAVAGLPEPVFVAGDQSDESVVVETVRTAVRTFGGLDGVVINAGIGVTATLDELTPARWRQALEVNLTSAFLLTRESMRVIRAQGRGGSLVFMASKNAFSPGAGFGAYSVSKAGMVQLMRIAALEGGRDGIRANAVNPDAVFDNSRLWSPRLRAERAAAHGVPEDELEDFYANRNLLHRHVTTSDVAESVIFLLSGASSRTTGCVLAVDGGVASAFPR